MKLEEKNYSNNKIWNSFNSMPSRLWCFCWFRKCWQFVIEPGMSFRIITTISLVAGTTFLMWLGEQITLRGVGNGISLIIFSGIVAEIPRALASTFELGRTGALSAVMIVGIFILVILTVLFIVFFERAMRKILINYPKRQVGNKMYGGSLHIYL